MSAPSADELLALAEKYATLGELRRAHARGEPHPPREVLRELARRFPGALNELDTMTLELIDERASKLRNASKTRRTEPWMGIVHSYHALYRAALVLKPLLAKLGADDARAREAAERAGLDDELVRAIAKPPRGRLTDVVLARVARDHAETEEAVARLVLPRPRR